MTPAAMAGSILYILHHIFVITNLYLVSGIFLRLRRTTNFGALGSIYRDYPGRRGSRHDSDLFAGRCTAAFRIHRQIGACCSAPSTPAPTGPEESFCLSEY